MFKRADGLCVCVSVLQTASLSVSPSVADLPASRSLHVCLSGLSACLSACLPPVCISACLSACVSCLSCQHDLPVCLRVCLVGMPARVHVCASCQALGLRALPACLSVCLCLLAFLSVCLSVNMLACGQPVYLVSWYRGSHLLPSLEALHVIPRLNQIGDVFPPRFGVLGEMGRGGEREVRRERKPV